MEDPAGAALLDPALELAIVPVIGGVGDSQVIGAGVWQMVNAESGVRILSQLILDADISKANFFYGLGNTKSIRARY